MPEMLAIGDLDTAIRAVAGPKYQGISVTDMADKATWKLAFAEGATQAERDAAQAIVDGYSVQDLKGPSKREQRQASFATDAGAADLLEKAKTASVAEIDAWLQSNVTNLAQARAVLAAIIKVLVARVL
jgi:hypothetical protein